MENKYIGDNMSKKQSGKKMPFNPKAPVSPRKQMASKNKNKSKGNRKY